MRPNFKQNALFTKVVCRPEIQQKDPMLCDMLRIENYGLRF